MAVSIQEISHFVMALTLSFEDGFIASLDFIEARRSSWALSLWGLSLRVSAGQGLLITTPPSGTHQVPTGYPQAIHRGSESLIGGGLGGGWRLGWREISYKKNPPKCNRNPTKTGT